MSDFLSFTSLSSKGTRAMTETSGPRQIIIGCDHAAYQLKETLKAAMEAQGITVTDVGTHSETSMDYPDTGKTVAEKISSGEMERAFSSAARVWVCPWWPTNTPTCARRYAMTCFPPP
jgi:hypothetical protein